MRAERSPQRSPAAVDAYLAPRFHAVQSRLAPGDRCRCRPRAPGQRAASSTVSDAVIASASTPCIPDEAVLIFHHHVCQFYSPRTNVSMLSKPRAFNCGHSQADCCVGATPCGSCCCRCHCCCCCSKCCCIGCKSWSSVNASSMLRVTQLRHHVVATLVLSQRMKSSHTITVGRKSTN